MRLVVADDSMLMRAGLVGLLEDDGFEVVAQAADAEDLLRKVGAHQPDVALVDVRMPPDFVDEGLRAARVIRERWPSVGVLVLSEHLEHAMAMELFADGTDGLGYLLKQRVTDLGQFGNAIRRVGKGGSALDPSVVSQLLGRHRGDKPLELLTAREIEVLGLVAEGRSNLGIAALLTLSERGVEKHITNIYEKLEIGSQPLDHRRVRAALTYLGGVRR
ncbi:MAG: response regulator transcription factor [Conexibacter sp.]|nr:response regulator transcription factor [Conexibacter sp.]